MKLEKALGQLRMLCGRSIDSIIEDLHEDRIINKGRVGQLLELYIGLNLGTNHTDFEDAELKTNKVRPNGKPRETIFLTQISRDIDIDGDVADDRRQSLHQKGVIFMFGQYPEDTLAASDR